MTSRGGRIGDLHQFDQCVPGFQAHMSKAVRSQARSLRDLRRNLQIEVDLQAQHVAVKMEGFLEIAADNRNVNDWVCEPEQHCSFFARAE